MTNAFFARARPAPQQVEPFRKPTKAVHALTSSASNEAYTPPDVLEAARASLGGVIDLDPASCAVANEEVRATFWCDASDLMLERGRPLSVTVQGKPTPAAVWLNPPGGFVHRETLLPAKRGMSQCCAWWRYLLDEYRAGRVKAACFYTFRLDVLQNIQALEGYEPPHAYPFCILKARPRHWSTGTPKEKRGKQGQPTHACAVFFLPEQTVVTPEGVRAWRQKSIELFRDSFAPLGFVR